MWSLQVAFTTFLIIIHAGSAVSQADIPTVAWIVRCSLFKSAFGNKRNSVSGFHHELHEFQLHTSVDEHSSPASRNYSAFGEERASVSGFHHNFNDFNLHPSVDEHSSAASRNYSVSRPQGIQNASMKWGKTLPNDILNGTAFSGLTRPVLVSGGAPGADAYWATAFAKFGQAGDHGQNVVALLASSNSRAEGLDGRTVFTIPETLVDNVRFKVTLEKVLQGYDPLTKQIREREPALLLRNFLTTLRAEAVFVVSFINTKSPQTLWVGGGAGIAAAMYLQRFKVRGSIGEEDPANMNLYVFDDCSRLKPNEEQYCYNPDTHHKWSKWNVEKNALEVIDGSKIPMPNGAFTGIGATRLSEKAKQAMDHLFIGWLAKDETGEGDDDSRAVRRDVYVPGIVLLIALFAAETSAGTRKYGSTRK